MAEAQRPFVVLGVTGGIAAYKAVEICRLLVDAGCHVAPVLTRDAVRFITPLTFTALASEPAQTELYDGLSPIPHTRLGQAADLIVIAPATAHLIGRYTHGLADDLLTNTLLATTAPVLLAPAMHTEMWEQPSVAANVELLRERGVHLVEPEAGRLAGGDVGRGRLAEPTVIVRAALEILAGSGHDLDLAGRRVVVSAGGTREPIDPVRYLSNRSSGKQGHALAEAAAARGAHVVLITTTKLGAQGVEQIIEVDTASELAAAMASEAPKADVIVMAAAVADFRPTNVGEQKLKKRNGTPAIELEPTEDILAGLVEARGDRQVIVGFAAETDKVLEHAREKLASKGCDLLVVNDVADPKAGFEHDTNEVTILERDGGEATVELTTKRQVADAVFDRVVAHLVRLGDRET
jgi:phosphopantothenoylcysteine decarboxylase / phosphopantothenate---cysteine ligase